MWVGDYMLSCGLTEMTTCIRLRKAGRRLRHIRYIVHRLSIPCFDLGKLGKFAFMRSCINQVIFDKRISSCSSAKFAVVTSITPDHS